MTVAPARLDRLDGPVVTIVDPPATRLRTSASASLV